MVMLKKLLITGGAVLILMLIPLAWYAIRGTSPPTKAFPSSIVELKDGDTYTLTASYVTKEIAGKAYKMLAYNGMIPGPEIHVPQGAEIKINLKNDTDLPTALHSHGVRVDNRYDGAVPTSQQEIPPGGSFEYKLKFPDTGIFWYHPHVDEVYEQPLGMYGAYVVSPNDSGYYPPVNSEHVLFLSDLPIENGTIAISKDGKDRSLMGHYGNVFLINGEEHYSLAAKTGEVMRLDVVNASNVRPYNFAIAGAKLKLVGSDNGAYEHATWRDSVILGPSERAMVDVMFDKAGTYDIQNRTPDGTQTLGQISVSDGTVQPSYAAQYQNLQDNSLVTSDIDRFRPYFAKAPDKKLVLSVEFLGMMGGRMRSMGSMGGMMNSMGMGAAESGLASNGTSGIEWNENSGPMFMMNNISTPDTTKWTITDSSTGRSNMDIGWTLKQGQPVKIEIYNDPNSMHPMQHPIHFHGQRFLVLSINGIKQTDLAWKDTVLVPAGATVDILLDPSNPGTWMAHCHIPEHLVSGMMFTYTVAP